MSKKAIINVEKCDKSPVCPAMRMCPRKAIVKEKKEGFFSFLQLGNIRVDDSLCTGCGICVSYCRRGAIEIVKK